MSKATGDTPLQFEPVDQATAEFFAMVGIFEQVGRIENTLLKEFKLLKLAPYFGLSRAQFARLFRLWQLERIPKEPDQAIAPNDGSGNGGQR